MTTPTRPDPTDLLRAFDHAPIGLCLSRQRVVEHCNAEFERMFGYGRGELIGQSLAPLYPSVEEFERMGVRGRAIMQKSGTYSDDRIMRDRSGRLFWCHVSGQTLHPADPFAFAIWVFEDLSRERPVSVALTSREREIAQFLVSGRTSKQIAAALSISPRTVEAHRARLMDKLNVSTTGEMIARLLSGGM